MRTCDVCQLPVLGGDNYPSVPTRHRSCHRDAVKSNRKERSGQYQRYEKRRNATPERKAFHAKNQKRMRKEHPEKYRARDAVANAIRDGRMTRQPCEVCSDPKSEAHHSDYSKPLDVRWFCKQHHEDTHHL